MTEYRGRFAPSPTGPLHLGSLFAAVISYLDAKANQGAWLLRIEDIDPPREKPNAKTQILNSLEKHGLFWDEPIVYQSQQSERYLEALSQLQQSGRLFWCNCSRKQLSNQLVYPGTCRPKKQPLPNHAARLMVTTGYDVFDDLFQGHKNDNILKHHGDVVLQRRDGLFAYQLAVVCDDIAQRITHVIRGIDLINSTYWQRELYRALGESPPSYGHFPVIVAPQTQQKLSKQNFAPAINDAQAANNLMRIFELLEISVEKNKPEIMLQQATEQWQRVSLFQAQNIESSGI